MNKNLKFSPNSMFDEFGRVFFYQDKVYRAISKNAIPECLELLNQPFFKELISLSLVPNTVVSDLLVPGYDLILEHEKLQITYQHEWSFSMFKDAALLILKIEHICEKYNYELKDAHTLNVLFKGSRPMYVDIGSFQKKRTNIWDAKDEFINSFYLPLYFWAESKFYITRKLLESKFYRMQTIPDQKFIDSGLLDLLEIAPCTYNLVFREKNIFHFRKRKNINRISKFLNKLASIYKRRLSYPFEIHSIFGNIEELNKKIQILSFPAPISLWKGYHSKFYGKDGDLKISERFSRILEIIDHINQEDHLTSTLDLAGNEGLISFLIKEKLKIARVTLSDYDENALEVAYKHNVDRDMNINILLMNFMFPPNIEDVSKRIKSDLVLALAVTHHLILTSNFLLATIFERIKAYSNKYVLIEFMPKGLWSIEHKQEVKIPDFYNLDWFKYEFNKYFEIIQIENLEENRILFVGKIREF